MSEREELAGIIKREYVRAVDRKRIGDVYNAPADAILAAGYRRPRTVATVEELDALAEGAVILCNGGEDSAQKDCEGYWYLWGGDIGLDPEEIALPAMVLHEPDPS